VVGLETELGFMQCVDQVAVVLGVLAVAEAAFHGIDQAGELLPALLAVLGPLDGGVQLVEQPAQIRFHAGHRTGWRRRRGPSRVRWTREGSRYYEATGDGIASSS